MGLWNVLRRGNWHMSSKEKKSWDEFYINLSGKVDELKKKLKDGNFKPWDSNDNEVKELIHQIISMGVDQIRNVLEKFRGKSLDQFPESSKGVLSLYKEVYPSIKDIKNQEICKKILYYMSNKNKIIKSKRSSWNQKIIEEYEDTLQEFDKNLSHSRVVNSTKHLTDIMEENLKSEKSDSKSGWESIWSNINKLIYVLEDVDNSNKKNISDILDIIKPLKRTRNEMNINEENIDEIVEKINYTMQKLSNIKVENNESSLRLDIKNWALTMVDIFKRNQRKLEFEFTEINEESYNKFLDFNTKLKISLDDPKFDPSCATWTPIALTISLEKLNLNKSKKSKLALLDDFIKSQAIIELIYILKGKYPDFATKTFTKIRNNGISECDKFDDKGARDLLQMVDNIVNKVSPLIKKEFSKISTNIIKKKFEKNFPREEAVDLAKMRIGWLLSDESEKKETLNQFWKQLQDAKIEINNFINNK